MRPLKSRTLFIGDRDSIASSVWRETPGWQVIVPEKTSIVKVLSSGVRVNEDLRAGSPSRDRFEPAHVWTEGLGDDHRAVRLLKVFQDREPRAADGQT